MSEFLRKLVDDLPTNPKEYPPPAFYFRVDIAGVSDTSFQEVTGIGPEIETEDVIEGGENRFVHRLPKSIRHPKLVLKRGVARMNSQLVNWCRDVLEGDFNKPFVTKEINVKLLNEEGQSFLNWSFSNAFPVHWEVEAFNSTKNDVAIETVEFVYSYSKRES